MKDDELRSAADKVLDAFDSAQMVAAQQKKHREETVTLLLGILEVLDSLDALEEHCGELERSGHREVPARSVSLVRRQLLRALGQSGVEPMVAMGKRLDLDLHEVVGVRSDAGAEPDTVLEETRPGYLLRDRMLRLARVVVAGDVGESDDTAHGAGEGTRV